MFNTVFYVDFGHCFLVFFTGEVYPSLTHSPTDLESLIFLFGDETKPVLYSVTQFSPKN